MYEYEESSNQNINFSKISDEISVDNLSMPILVFLAVFVTQILNYVFMGMQ